MNDQPVVLYVEDDPQSRRLMSMLLTGRMGLKQVTILEDSKDFVARMEALDPQPNLIFLDIQIKPLNGFEMLAALRQMERYRDTKVVALTASVMNEEVQNLRAAGFNGCFAKPIDMRTFPDLIARVLDGASIWRITK